MRTLATAERDALEEALSTDRGGRVSANNAPQVLEELLEASLRDHPDDLSDQLNAAARAARGTAPTLRIHTG